MYESYYKLTGKPFQLSPDPYFFFGSSTHKRALAYLRYGLSQGEGFIVVTGDVGTGKSTLVRTLFGSLEKKEDVIAAQLVNTQLDATDILRMVAATFGLAHQNADKASVLKHLETFCISRVREAKRVMLVVDEAQNLPWESLEELRMLSNLHHQGRTLIQIFLLGQSEFRDTLRHPGLEQVRQRVTASYHLSPLDPEETQAYIEHRLHKVEWKEDPVFTAEAYQRVFEFTGGIPRKINTICDRLLLFGFLEEKHKIDGDIVNTVAEELQGEMFSPGVGHKAVVDNPKAVLHYNTPVAEGDLAARLAQMEKDLSELKRRFQKEREFMRKVVMLSLNFGEEEGEGSEGP